MKVERDAPTVTSGDGDGAARPRAPGTGTSSTWVRLLPFAVGGLLLLALVFRFVTTSDLWLDEALSVNIAKLPLNHLHQALKEDGAPPLYYLLLHFWIKVFGSGDLAVRSLSGVIGVLTLPVSWLCGRRLARNDDERRWLPWATVLVVGFSPYAIRYATETRMYGLEILLVLLGYLALRNALDRPRPGNLVAVGIIAGLLLYTQYWALYLLAVVGALLLGFALWSDRRHQARAALAALVVGGLTFVPWIPTFLYQAKHTGTPWGRPVAPPTGVAFTFLDFAGSNRTEGWMLVLPLILLALLAVFARAADDNHIDLDVRTRPGVRWEALVMAAGLVLGLAASFVARSAFQPRYASIVFGIFALVVAFGTLAFARPVLRIGALALVIVLGLVGGVRNVVTNRTQASQSTKIIAARARPGDVVMFCPDQVGPDASRLLPSRLHLDQVVFPTMAFPDRVDWIDYKKRNEAADVPAFAKQLLQRAGNRTIWYVYSANYLTFGTKCDDLITALAQSRPVQRLVAPDDVNYFEYMGLVEFPARP
jgi:mannosyltransferase